jgi:hypothetical protein
MHSAAPALAPIPFCSIRFLKRWGTDWAPALWLCWACWLPGLCAAAPQLAQFNVVSNNNGVFVSYALSGALAPSIDEALSKAIPLYFVVEAELFRDRWYWRDRRVANASRVWRIVFQPLTDTYRVTFGSLSQNYSSRTEAFASISQASNWKIAEPGQIESQSTHYVEFSYRLDTSLLPRPLQIGVGSQAEWDYAIQHTQALQRAEP